jgi:S-adenosylmethionine hydrolase
MTVITLTTDFGLADGYVGIMKGVILTLVPGAQLVDLSHEIAPQDIRRAALILAQAAPYFPSGTVHLAVVDPGVGGERRPIIVQTARAFFVGPDNGLFTAALGLPGARAFVANQPQFWRAPVSHTFHGRDVFAPLAAHLARGVAPETVGAAIADAVRLSLPAPVRLPDGSIAGEIAYADRFGNLVSNIPGAWLAGRQWRCQVAGRTIQGPVATYAAAAPGALLTLVNSGGTLEIAVREGSAERALNAHAGEKITLAPAREMPTQGAGGTG